MEMKKLHLVCNAHLDPVWLWEWEEGAAEAVSTFRIAADFCERYDGFVFNHNEVILYQWVEEYEPKLFRRIQRLVAKGKWHIMGGWYLQPDCNMPSGESFIRQISAGRRYFMEKFGARPTTAINFDPFGHNRGLVQILAKAGFDSYIVCRPGQEFCELPEDEFLWEGFAGSEVIVHRGFDNYLTLRGHAVEKIEKYVQAYADRDTGLLLWGIGNHGGGPSRVDLEAIGRWAEEHPGIEVTHSTPERYFQELKACCAVLPRVTKALNPFAVGCYTSQVRVKQKHRSLENELYLTEKMMSAAVMQGLMEYGREECAEAERDLLMAEFHDILPGSSIQAVEEDSLRLLDHGLEILSRLKARAFVALLSGQSPAKDGEIPIFVFNPHPYPVRSVFECEFQLADQNWSDTYTLVRMERDGQPVACQTEQEASNINLDWRKHVAFQSELAPGSMTRFSARFVSVPRRPRVSVHPENGAFCFNNGELEVAINTATGLIDTYRVHGEDILRPGAFALLVMADDEDPWGMKVNQFRSPAGQFELMPPAEGAAFSGLEGRCIDSVHAIEDGPVRTVLEAVLQYGHSFVCQRYKLPKQGTEIEVECRVYWQEKNKFLKLSVPTVFDQADYLGQVAFGVESLPADGFETVAQKWVALSSLQHGLALTCINEGSYGSDCAGGEIRLSLLRSPGYSAHPIKDRPVMPQGRFSPRIDQGERFFRFWINAGDAVNRLRRVDHEALAHNEKPYILSYYPSGEGRPVQPAVTVDAENVQLSTLMMAEDGTGYIIRLYETCGMDCSAKVAIPSMGLEREVSFRGFEVKMFHVNAAVRSLEESGLV